jgi:transposase-like protein
MDKHTLSQALQAGQSFREIGSQHGRSAGSIRYWARKYGLTSRFQQQKVPLPEQAFREAVTQNTTVAGVLRQLGRAAVGTSYKKVHAEVARLGLDTSHWKGLGHGTSYSPKKIPWGEILILDSPHKITHKRKKALLREGFLTEKCAMCGMPPLWKGAYLGLRLDHINGNRTDNRIGNLRMVCPNCDSQLPTYCGRNKRRA